MRIRELLARWRYCLVSGEVFDADARYEGIVKKICICLRRLVYASASPRLRSVLSVLP
jgi:hypothetical protein